MIKPIAIRTNSL